MKPRYSKPPLLLPDQVQLLLGRGLSGVEADDLQRVLSRISLYRLRGYTFPFQEQDNPNHPFKAGADWETIQACYKLDQKMRLLFLSAIETIEVALRSQVALEFSNASGAQWYEDKSLFFKKDLWESDLKSLDEEWNRSQEAFVLHYRNKYNESYRPPAWMIMETCSFGTLSKIFENLRIDLEPKKRIAQYFGCKPRALPVLASWVHHLSVVRNICAHHGRLYSRILIQSPKYLEDAQAPWVLKWSSTQRIYVSICIMAYLLQCFHEEHKFKCDLVALLEDVKDGQILSMGFPSEWKSQPLWRM